MGVWEKLVYCESEYDKKTLYSYMKFSKNRDIIKIITYFNIREIFPLFSPSNFTASGPIFNTLIHLEFLNGMNRLYSIFLHMDAQLPQHHISKKQSFHNVYFYHVC